MLDVKKVVTINAPLEKVWAALADAHSIGVWMNDDKVRMTLSIGGSCTFFDGETTGKVISVTPPRHLEYSWRQAGWHARWKDSVVQWTLRKSGEGTRVTLIHNQFPNQEERDSHAEGWDIYWLQPMKAWLERQR